MIISKISLYYEKKIRGVAGMLTVENLSFNYHKKQILDDVSLRLRKEKLSG